MTIRTVMFIGAGVATFLVLALVVVGIGVHIWWTGLDVPAQPPAAVAPKDPEAKPADPVTIEATPAVTQVRVAWAKDGTGMNFFEQSGNPTGYQINVPADATGKLTRLPLYKPDATQLTYFKNTKAAADRNTKVLQQILDDMPDSGGILEIQGDVAINGLVLPTISGVNVSNVIVRGSYPGVNILNLNKDVPAIRNVPNIGSNATPGRIAYQRLENLNILSPGTGLDITGEGLNFSFNDVAVSSCGQTDRNAWACKFREMYGWNTGELKVLSNMCNGVWLESCGDVTFTKITVRGNLGIGLGMKYCFGICGSIDAEANSDWNIHLDSVWESRLQVWMEQRGWKYAKLTDELTQGKLINCGEIFFVGHGLHWEADTASRYTCRNNGQPVGYTETSTVDAPYFTSPAYCAWAGATKPVLTIIDQHKYVVSVQNYASSPPGWVNPCYDLNKLPLKAGDVLEVIVNITGNATVYEDYGKEKKQPAGFIDLAVAGATANLPITLFAGRTEQIKLRLAVPKDTVGARLLHMVNGYVAPAAGTTHDYLVEVQSIKVTR